MSKAHLKILIIDDTPANLQLLGSILEQDYLVQVATSGERGLQLAQKSHPDLILLDIMMPVMDGFEVCRQLKLNSKLASIPVIFITALIDNSTEEKCLALGAVDFLTKPLNIKLARLRIDNFMEREALRREVIMKKQLKLAASVFNHSHDAILITDADNKIIDVNASFTRITGYELNEVLGENPSILHSGKQNKAFYQTMWGQLLKNEFWDGEMWNQHKDGTSLAVEESISVITDSEGNIDHFLGIFSDITLRKTHEEDLKKIAYFDELTGTPNRTLLADRLEQGIAQSVRRKKTMALCFLDLDGFKQVNDQFGHDTGDKLLIETTQRIYMCLRKVDTLSRIGGDEFIILLLDLNAEDEFIISIERILDALQQPFLIDDNSISISASIGVTLFPQNDNDSDMLLRHADQAMYTAKQKGKNQYHLFDSELNLQALKQEQLISHIKAAFNNNEFVLHYQPKVNLSNGQIQGFEALIRWQHPTKGLLAPAEFLPLIDNTDLMLDLSDWVIATAIKQLNQWQAINLKLIISVNIAPCHLVQENFVSQLQKHLQVYPDVRPENLELEILETAALDDVLRVSEIMKSCMDLGVHFSLDDFGTGYCSLTYLKNLPVKTLKIDQTFIRDMLVDSEDMAITVATIGLAKAFNRGVIAEGVETVEHGKRLLEIGCNHAQGYGIARPMPINEVNDWMQRWEFESKAFQKTQP